MLQEMKLSNAEISSMRTMGELREGGAMIFLPEKLTLCSDV